MSMRTRSLHIIVTEASQTAKFRVCSFVTALILVNKSYRHNIFCGPVFFRRIKRTNDTTILQARFFYNMFLYSLTNLRTHHCNSLILASI